MGESRSQPYDEGRLGGTASRPNECQSDRTARLVGYVEGPPDARSPDRSATQRITDESELGRVRHAPELHRPDPVHEAERGRAEPDLVRV